MRCFEAGGTTGDNIPLLQQRYYHKEVGGRGGEGAGGGGEREGKARPPISAIHIQRFSPAAQYRVHFIITPILRVPTLPTGLQIESAQFGHPA